MSFLLAISILTLFNQKEDNLAPQYFFRSAVCHNISYTVEKRWQLDLKSTGQFTLTKTIKDSRDINNNRFVKKKNGISKVGITYGEWKMEGGIVILYPSFSTEMPIQFFSKEVSFKIDENSLHKTSPDNGTNCFPDVMTAKYPETKY